MIKSTVKKILCASIESTFAEGFSRRPQHLVEAVDVSYHPEPRKCSMSQEISIDSKTRVINIYQATHHVYEESVASLNLIRLSTGEWVLIHLDKSCDSPQDRVVQSVTVNGVLLVFILI